MLNTRLIDTSFVYELTVDERGKLAAHFTVSVVSNDANRISDRAEFIVNELSE